ncbi:MAG: accessory factor UbiK family protein [Thermodesulfobacteriota bacterium]
MSDLLDKVLLVGMGLETKLKEVLSDLEKSGEKERGEGGGETEGGKADEGKGLTPKQAVENRIVDEGTAVVKELLSVVDSAKIRIEEELSANSGRIRGKLHVAGDEEIEVVKEMARLAREKVDSLEKRVAELEAKLKKK